MIGPVYSYSRFSPTNRLANAQAKLRALKIFAKWAVSFSLLLGGAMKYYPFATRARAGNIFIFLISFTMAE